MILLIFFLSFWLGLALSSAWIALSITAVVFLLFVYKRFKFKTFLISFVFLALGSSISFIHISRHKHSYQGFVYQSKENYFLFNSGGERLYVNIKNHQYDIGDYLTITGEKEDLSFNMIESSFDFKRYLIKRGVYKALKANDVKVKFHNPIRIQTRREKLLSHFNDETKSIVGAILFSDGGDSELSGNLRDLHLARFLSASGLFIAAFYRFINGFLSRHMKDKYSEAITIGILSFYTIFTFPLFSVTRVMLFLIIKWINTHILKKKFSYLTLLSFLGFFCLLLNPYLARQDSFILGILIPLVGYLTRNVYRTHKIKHWCLRFLIVYLLFIPFEMSYYNKIVIFTLPLQILLTPIFLLIGIISLLCFFYVPLYPVITFLITVLKGITSFISPLAIGVNVPSFNQFLLIIYYLLYILWLIYLSRRFVPIHRFLLVSLFSLIAFYAIPIKNYISNEVNFINVGQGDCTLVRNKNKTVLIDTGGLSYMDVANDSLVPFLRKKRIYKIDAVFITHYDYDHYGALSSLTKSYKINNVYDYHSSFPISVGHLTFNNYNYYAKGDDENDKSLVLSFSNCGKNFVIMGDAPTYVEKEIIKNVSGIKCDVLKVGHHGSNTSTSEEWLKYLEPKEAVVSCGKNNKFGHPNKEVVALLNKYRISIRRTDLEGTIVYKQLSF